MPGFIKIGSLASKSLDNTQASKEKSKLDFYSHIYFCQFRLNINIIQKYISEESLHFQLCTDFNLIKSLPIYRLSLGLD